MILPHRLPVQVDIYPYVHFRQVSIAGLKISHRMESMSIKRISGRIVRLGAIAAASVGMLIGLTPLQAQAASSISANLTVSVYGDYNTANIDVHLPMSQQDAAGYLYNNAQIRIGCWGDDQFSDDWLLSYTLERDPYEEDYSASGDPYRVANNKLYAAADGVRLRAVITTKHNAIPWKPIDGYPYGIQGFNEDPGYTLDGMDEIYCRATWIDGDGARLAAITPVRSGWF